MRYNIDMEKIQTLIIGGGASGLFLATSLSPTNGKTVILERGERVGRKLSATGNGQGNVTNLGVLREEYFSSSADGATRARSCIEKYDNHSLLAHLKRLGVLLIQDERGRVYPAGRQASSLTDALRFTANARGVELRTNMRAVDLADTKQGFVVTAENSAGERERILAENVVLCTGGAVARTFGTDGSAYALAQKFGHTLTPLYPSLVQLKTASKEVRSLKGVRVMDADVSATWTESFNGKKREGKKSLHGDIIFADYGVSGDAIFRLSAYLTPYLDDGVQICMDFLPSFTEEEIYGALLQKRENFPFMPVGELLGGFVNNQVGRVVMKRAKDDLRLASKTVKAFELAVTGHLGLDFAQVTKGGIRLEEVDEQLQSKFVKGLYFAGEILDVDGPCGGFNLQWAYSSARVVAEAIDEKMQKRRGQV